MLGHALARALTCLETQAQREEPRVGGQAVIEGVMMRDPTGWAVVVRAPDGRLRKRVERQPSFASKHRWARLPFVRGAVVLVESMVVGFRALSWSADVFTSLPEKSSSPREAGRSDASSPDSGSGVVSVLGAVAIAVTLFVIVPALISHTLLARLTSSALARSAFEGVIRVAVLVGYIVSISRLEEVRRVFEYHGAEHQTIAAYEEGESLVPESIGRYSTRHPRCGTSFLLTVMVVAIAVFAVVRGSLPLGAQLVARVVLLPVVAGISYEAIRLGWTHRRRLVGRVLMAPGLALQAITTRTPDASQVEVAVASLKALLTQACEDSTEGVSE